MRMQEGILHCTHVPVYACVMSCARTYVGVSELGETLYTCSGVCVCYVSVSEVGETTRWTHVRDVRTPLDVSGFPKEALSDNKG